MIIMALLGILVVWCAGKAGEKRSNAEQKILREYAIKENERADVFPVEKQEIPKETKTMESVPQKEAKESETIRVLLMTNGYAGYHHSAVTLRAQGNYEIKGAKTGRLSNGETIELRPGSELFDGESMKFSPMEAGSRLQILSLSRGQGNPSYQGTITVYQDEEGLRMINELELEQYLCGVVPSEMPASYPMEALKAQAVCARTYACVQMQGTRLEKFGAQVDDSVSFQVYQNSGEFPESSQAVLETAGQILLNNAQPINAYYFSTSHGRTSTDEVWEASVPSGYLKSVACTYDAEEPWYQWSLTLSVEKLSENARNLFPDVNRADGIEIKNIGEGEAVLELALHTDCGEKKLHSEYDIRSLLAPSGVEITRQDGSVVMGSKLLPSAYFTLKEKKTESGSLIGYEITGGGYGHGVGMSQNGAKGMANAGKTYEEILAYFYRDVELGNLEEVVNLRDS